MYSCAASSAAGTRVERLVMKPFSIDASDGVRIPLTWFPADPARYACLFLPALGIQARLYHQLAIGLAASGCSVCLLEQRGHGESPLRASRAVEFGMTDFLEKDIPAALSWLRAQAPGLPVLMGGHSLGGNLSTLYAGEPAAGLSGLIHVACGSPYHGDFPPRQSRLIRLLCTAIPLLRVFPGYFPGEVMGFAGRESLQLMRDWRDWALTGTLDYGGRIGLAERAGSFRGPVISIAIENDDFSSAAARERALAPLRSARITRLTLGAAEQGEYLGHFKWARRPDGVVRALADWMQRELA